MPRQWFIKTKSGRIGPLTSDKLSRLASSGKLSANMGVSHDGRSWIKAKQVPGLSFPETNPAGDTAREPQERFDQWFVLTKHNVAGPFTHRQLRKLARRGRIQPNVGVSRDKVKWTKAKRIPGLQFPGDSGEIQADTDVQSTKSIDAFWVGLEPGRQLRWKLFVGNDPFQYVSPPKQRTWFGIDPTATATPVATSRSPVATSSTPVATSRSRDDWPLFHRSRPAMQPWLFCEHNDAAPTTPPRQLRLTLMIGDEPFADYRYRCKQRTLFAVDNSRAQCSHSPTRPANTHFPLFHWPPRQTQLRFFVADAAYPGQPSPVDVISPRQLKFSMSIGAGQQEKFSLATRWQQLSMFPVEASPPALDRQTSPTTQQGLPLFTSPPTLWQLTLFDEESVSTRNNNTMGEPKAPAEDVLIAEQREVTGEIGDQPQPPPNETEASGQTLRWLKTQWAITRKREYVQRFGPYSHIARPQHAGITPVDVYIFPATPQRPITTLITSGMSDQRMPLPPGRCSPRAELVLYVDQAKPEYVNLLYFLAQIPGQQQLGLRYGSALSHGDPPQPIFPQSRLDGYVFLIPSVSSDFQIHESTRIGDDPLQLLWVVPVTSAERNFLAAQGMAQFCCLLDQNQHPLAFDPGRSCYVDQTASESI